ncbi:Uncharacterised protein [Mycobacteroides abscessus subsp. massiliense]|nr:Uncharacterised protein [Mycobacteroides abscessus subsp. massiliense]
MHDVGTVATGQIDQIAHQCGQLLDLGDHIELQRFHFLVG